MICQRCEDRDSTHEVYLKGRIGASKFNLCDECFDHYQENKEESMALMLKFEDLIEHSVGKIANAVIDMIKKEISDG